MTASVRPHTTALAALLMAGVVATAPAVPQHYTVPVLRTATVQPASVVTNLLNNLGTAAESAANVIDITSSGLLALPFNTFYALVGAVADPAATASLFSNLVQQYLNPLYSSALDPYAVEFAQDVLVPLAFLIPGELGKIYLKAVDAGAAAAGNAMKTLPDPAAGLGLISQFTSSNSLGRLLFAAQMGLYTPFAMLGATVGWLGSVPAELEATAESALRNPSQIPGLLSQLVYDVLSPKNGLLGQVSAMIVYTASLLPQPIGDNPVTNAAGFARKAYNAFAAAVTNLLKAVLPAPVTPTPFPSAAVASTPSAASPTVQSGLESASAVKAVAPSVSAMRASRSVHKPTAAKHPDRTVAGTHAGAKARASHRVT